MRILVIAAHPDDEILGCGGTVAALADAGHEVHSLILGEGATSRHDSSIHDDGTGMLATAAAEAARQLGAAPPRLLGLPDNRLDSLPLLDITQRIEAVVAEIGPTLILTHFGNDLNLDHAIVHRATLTAGRPLPSGTLAGIYAFETLSSTEWASANHGPTFHPQVFVDISATLDRKLAALSCYDSEMRSFPHPRSETAIRALAQLRGSQAGLAAAEAFEVVWARGRPGNSLIA